MMSCSLAPSHDVAIIFTQETGLGFDILSLQDIAVHRIGDAQNSAQSRLGPWLSVAMIYPLVA